MRLPQHWLYGRVPRWVWQRGTHRVQITPACHRTFSPWTDPSFLRAVVPLELVSRQAVLLTDASATGLGATYNKRAVSGVWTGPQLRWHTNCLELLAVLLAAYVPTFAAGRQHGSDRTYPGVRHGCTGTQMALGPAQICVPPVSLLAQTLCKIRENEEQVLLVASYCPSRTRFPRTHDPRDSPSLVDSSEEGSAFSETGHPLAPALWKGHGGSR